MALLETIIGGLGSIGSSLISKLFGDDEPEIPQWGTEFERHAFDQGNAWNWRNYNWNKNTWAAQMKRSDQAYRDQRADVAYAKAIENQRWIEQKELLTQERLRQDSAIQRMVRDANLAGIHPVAALGNAGVFGGPVTIPSGGGSAIGGGRSDPAGGAPGSSTFQPNPPTIMPSQPGIGDAIGDGLMALGNYIQNRQRNQLENQLLQAQIGQINSQTAANAADIADATSRTMVSKAREAGQGGRGSARVLDIGLVSPPGFQPVSEYDDWMVSIDQAIKDVVRVISNDPVAAVRTLATGENITPGRESGVDVLRRRSAR